MAVSFPRIPNASFLAHGGRHLGDRREAVGTFASAGTLSVALAFRKTRRCVDSIICILIFEKGSETALT